ncbi:hypothetical protein PN836_016245 [Ningiella sp. W23]|uniref:hypothetical protein n=1 Tax=Ningiella sp. W23 TaxID=3023715 RepID=UPI003757275C
MIFQNITNATQRNTGLSTQKVMCKYSMLTVSFVCAFFSQAASAVDAENATKNPQACVKIDNDIARLACFDAIFTAPEVTQVQTQPMSAVSPPVSVQTNKTAIDTSTFDESELAKANEKSEDDRVAEFGAEDLKASAADEEELNRIESTIVSASENSRNIRTFTLENGQVWRESESSRLRLKEGMDVFVEKGAFSSHFMGKESSNRRVRVNRVK